jgi:predicted extracellular nuclease
VLTEPIALCAGWRLLLGALALLLAQPAAAQSTLGRCGEAATAISRVQGSGARSPLEGEIVVIEASVAADLRASPLQGVFVQEEPADQDGDVASSEGLFVYGVAAGDMALPRGAKLRALGKIVEWSGLTELSSVSELAVCPGFDPVVPTVSRLPLASADDWERLEGMLVHIPQTLTVTGNFELGRYGSLELSAGGRLYQPTQQVHPGPAAVARQDQNDRSRIVLDDASSEQNPSPIPYLDAAGTRRVGDTVRSLTGVVDERYGAYRLHPSEAPVFASGVERPRDPPEIGGRLRIASLNVFNYFTTLDAGRTGCGPDASLECRGANSRFELERQRAKLVRALAAIDADIVGLIEIQNDAGAALQDLVGALNAQLSSSPYAALDTGTLGSDAIKLALLYRPATVAPVGPYALLTSAVDPRFADDRQRPALAQTFVEHRSQEGVTLVLTHLKSKSSACTDADDPDLHDGQGDCNRTRTAAAQALVSWIASDPTHSGDPDVLLLGDLNAYAQEDPVATLEVGGLRALVGAFIGPWAYSYQFNGQSGYLDHALATPSLFEQVTGIAHWHINADEPAVLDYNTELKTDDRFDATQPFRASDHDPLLVGLWLSSGTWSLIPRLHLAPFLSRVRSALQYGFERNRTATP